MHIVSPSGSQRPPSLLRRCRDYSAIALLALFVFVILVAAFVAVKTNNSWLVIPFSVVAYNCQRQMRWVMFWFSTPAERAAFAPERETVVEYLKAWRGGAPSASSVGNEKRDPAPSQRAA